jgi:hypothetical protein
MRLKPENLVSLVAILPASCSNGRDPSDRRNEETSTPREVPKFDAASVMFVLSCASIYLAYLELWIRAYSRATLPARLIPTQVPPALSSRPDRTRPGLSEDSLAKE